MPETRSTPLLPGPAGVGRRIDAFWRRMAAWFEARLRPGGSGRLDLASIGSLVLAILLLPVALALILTVLVVFAVLALVLLVLGLFAGFMLGAVTGLVIVGVVLLRRGRARDALRKSIPFGPFLCLGALLPIVVG